MMEQMASQVRALRSSRPIRPFKDEPLKIACIGNCVLNKIALLFKMQPGTDVVFFSNLGHWGNYHAESFQARAQEADIIIANSSSTNSNLFHTPDELRADYGDKCVFIPLIWLDGMDSLQMFSLNGKVRFFGGDAIVERAESVGFDKVVDEMARNEFSTDLRGRFETSIENLKIAEQGSVKMSDFVLEHYRERPLANSVGHPSSIVLKEMFSRLATQMDVKVDVETMFTPDLMGRLQLPGTRRVFSPYDVEEMGFTYDHDPDWLLHLRNLCTTISQRVSKGTYLTSFD